MVAAPMAKSNSPDTPKWESAKGSSAITLLALWPYYLFAFVTRGLPGFLRGPIRFIGYPAITGLYLLIVPIIIYGARSSQYDLEKIHEMPMRTVIFDRNGNELGRIHGEKRDVIQLSEVSESFKKAIIAREDERFYKHGVVDPIGLCRAVLKNFQGKREGASTITQQLASDVFGLKLGEGDKSKFAKRIAQLDRKCLEIAIGMRIESSMTKDEILQAYVNSINWGRQIRGIEEASRIYFEKHAAELDLSESAMLAGIVRGPDAYNPFKDLKAALRERDTTLDRMVIAKMISQAEADAAKKDKLDVRPASRRKSEESYAMDAIRRDLEIILEEKNIELGGLSIRTTIDSRIQEKAEEAVNKRLIEVERMSGFRHPTRAAWLKKPEDSRGVAPYIQGSAVVMENATGNVLAVVGGRDASESKFNRAQQGNRQIGSIFKPFVYMAAFDAGLRPSTAIDDGPIQPGEIKGAGTWRPHNSDNTYTGMQPVAYGLIRSRNTMSVRVGNYAGIDRIKEMTSKLGFDTDFPEKPTSFLGAWEATPWEVASAYTVFPNRGKRLRPFLIAEIKDRHGNVLFTNYPLGYQAVKEGSAWSVSRILHEVTTRGTAASVKRLGFDKPCAGKTGTTNDFKDAWFAGYTSALTCAVWVGFDQPQQTIHGGYGSVLALPIWAEIMKTADRLGYKGGELHDKMATAEIRLCRQSGKRATAGCEDAGSAYIDRVPADIALPENDLCPIHPAKALPVNEGDLDANSQPRAPRALPVEDSPMRAIPVLEDELDE